MCKLVIGIKQPIKVDRFTQILKAQFDELKAEKDGASIFVIDKNDEVFIDKTMVDYELIFEEALERVDGAKFISLHTRTGTSGSKDLTNVHFFDSNGYYFAHNGFVSEYSTKSFSPGKSLGWGWNHGESLYPHKKSLLDKDVSWEEKKNAIKIGLNINQQTKDEEIVLLLDNCRGCQTSSRGYCKKHKKEYSQLLSSCEEDYTQVEKTEVKVDKVIDECDSHQFLINIPKPITKESLEREILAKGFTGMGVLINPKRKEIFLMIKKTCQALIKEDFGMFFSYEPSLEYEETVWGKKYNVPFVKKENVVEIKMNIHRIGYGVHQVEYPTIKTPKSV